MGLIQDLIAKGEQVVSDEFNAIHASLTRTDLAQHLVDLTNRLIADEARLTMLESRAGAPAPAPVPAPAPAPVQPGQFPVPVATQPPVVVPPLPIVPPAPAGTPVVAPPAIENVSQPTIAELQAQIAKMQAAQATAAEGTSQAH